MSRTAHWLTLILSTALLASCGSSPAVRYFGLETTELNYQQDTDDAPILAVGPLRVPDYLKRSQMVRRGQGAELLVDDFNRWAEPLDEAIHRTIASNVDGMVDNLVAIAFPTGAGLDVDYRVFGRIDKFEQDNSGSAILDIQWGISDAAGDIVAAVRRVRYESRAGDRSDPMATAQAMSATIEQLSREIAAEMADALP